MKKINNLHEIETFRNRHDVFADRHDAGRVLAAMLAEDFEAKSNLLVLAIPSGGVPVGLEVAGRLGCDFDFLIVRKLQIPGNTEAGFGAMSLDGKVYFNDEMLDWLNLDERQIEEEIGIVNKELQIRNALFRQGKPFPEVEGMTVLLVDDGLASGYTMLTAADTLREKGAARIVVAIPTAPLSSIERLADEVDDIYCLQVQDFTPFAVANAYRHWRDLSREEVVEMLDLDILRS